MQNSRSLANISVFNGICIVFLGFGQDYGKETALLRTVSTVQSKNNETTEGSNIHRELSSLPVNLSVAGYTLTGPNTRQTKKQLLLIHTASSDS